MFKELPFNPRYKFDLDGNFLFRGQLYKNDGTTIKIDDILTGKFYRFSKGWLGLIAYHEIRLPTDMLSSINFVRCEARHFRYKSGYLMVFRKPVVLERDFRVVPGYTRYNVNAFGVVKSINTGTISKTGVNAFGYPIVRIYDDDKRAYRNACLHLLIARAWVNNPEPNIRLFVNHKDGVKSNFSIHNLEWVTGVENSAHAIRSGLMKMAVKCQVLDLEDGSVSEYSSIGEARRAIEVSVRGSGPTYRKINGVIFPALLKNRYVIRKDSDPGFYADPIVYRC
ncbi:MAG TPA: HNH endonuclease [Anaerolineales bacterium]|nr:HNH endonuclease [Anaerolineales bacterium]